MLAAYDLETGEQVASHALPHWARALCPLEDDKVWVAHAQGADELSGAVLSLADGTWEAASRPARCVGAVEQESVSCGTQTMLGTGSGVTCAPTSRGRPDEALELTHGASRVLLEVQPESGVVAPIALGQPAAGSPWRVSLLSDPAVGVGKLPLAVDLQDDGLFAVVSTKAGPLHVVRVDAEGQRVWETPAPGWPAANHAKLLMAEDRVYVAHGLRVSVFDRATGTHLGDVGDTTWFYGTSCAGGTQGFAE
jgi:outer membrane protein assembly factor BamB